MIPLAFEHDDGGREAAGFKGEAGDCVVRSIAIAARLPYRYVYDALAAGESLAGRPRSAREGVGRDVYERFLTEVLGWDWTPTMTVGSGCRIHLRADELPAGALVVRLSKHVTAVVDATIRDTYNPDRGGTRCVYGYYREETTR